MGAAGVLLALAAVFCAASAYFVGEDRGFRRGKAAGAALALRRRSKKNSSGSKTCPSRCTKPAGTSPHSSVPSGRRHRRPGARKRPGRQGGGSGQEPERTHS